MRTGLLSFISLDSNRRSLMLYTIIWMHYMGVRDISILPSFNLIITWWRHQMETFPV